MIGLDLADELAERGYEVAGPFTCAEALAWIRGNTPDLAVLDVALQLGSCVRLARELQGREVPILVFSSYLQQCALPEFGSIPWLSMPAPMDLLHSALVGLCAEHPGICLPASLAA
ncbi:response regulator [Microvirga massiliensis]|uniref:response regulator n=1 Tax=Microvirga massiliensis TaxID=1033741 RepID=UPI0006616C22|nr:response regulator [Microvirga massiliensis]